jgi:AraC family transcriptional regulator of adaptative response / DNA-3-methyladenine glycosylase II
MAVTDFRQRARPPPSTLGAVLDTTSDIRYRAVSGRDVRFDGRFVTAVTSTGIYCRPSCPARTPLRKNVRFFVLPAAAEAAGFRACRRCRPDAAPGSSEWDVRGDLVARALRLLADGAADTDGVGAVARRLAVSERHLHRLLVAEVGVGPLAIARTRRAQAARMLLESTALPASDVAFAAGFGSVRQFNDAVRAAFGCTPTELRRQPVADTAAPGRLVLRLQHRRPLAVEPLLGFFAARAVPGLEAVDARSYRRVLALPRSYGRVDLSFAETHVVATLRLGELADLSPAVRRCRDLLDLDADPDAVGAVLGADELLAPLVAARPGLRVPGAIDGFELAVRAVLGQQVSVAGARTLLGRLVDRLGPGVPGPDDALVRAFPSAAQVAGADLSDMGVPGSRARALGALAAAVAAGDLVLDRGADRAETRRRLLALPGVGPWTASYVAMRALGDPDAFPAGDLGLRRAVENRGLAGDPRALEDRSTAWRPWRAYAAMHLWSSLADPTRG